MTTRPANISVVDPVSQAVDRTKQVLFRPFDLTKWFMIGFCAWLAGLGEGGGAHFSSPPGGGGRGGGPDFRHTFEQGRDYVLHNLHWIVPLAAVVIFLILSLWILFLWLNSRGKFMFLHCVALNKGEVGEPWQKYAPEANSLCWFRLVLGLAGMTLILPMVGFVILVFARMASNESWNFAGVAGGLALVATIFLVGLVIGIIDVLTKHFVVPIMFLRRKRCLESWAILRELLTANVGRFVLYLLFQLLLSTAIGILLLTITVLTCCIAGCLMAIPYLGTVLLLPVLVFMRAYSLLYLSQYGPEYNVFQPASNP